MAGAPDVAVLAGAAVICGTRAWNQRCPRAPVAQLAEPVPLLPVRTGVSWPRAASRDAAAEHLAQLWHAAVSPARAALVGRQRDKLLACSGGF